MALLVILVSIALTAIVSTLAGAMAMKSLGIGVPRIDLGVWAPKVRFAAAGSDVSLSPWLLTGSATYKDVGNADLYRDRPGKLLGSFSRPVRALVHLAGAAAVLAVACLFAGPDALVAFAAAFRQVVEGALHPLSHAQAYLSAFDSLVDQSPASGMGIVSAKFAAFMLLPMPPLAGGQALLQLFRPRDRGHARIADPAQKIGMTVLLIILPMWLVATGWWLVNGGAF